MLCQWYERQDADGPHGPCRTGCLAGAAPVASIQVHARSIRKAAIRAVHRYGFVGASRDARGAFAAVRQKTDIQVHHGPADQSSPLVRQRKARDGAAGADLVATVAILPAVILAEAQLRREQARRAARAEVGLDDLGGADLGAVAAAHADAREARLVQ